MLGCLIVAALVAVVAVLAGSFDSIVWKALETVFSAAIHIGILFLVLSITSNNDENPALVRSANFVINGTMVIAILSFFTSIFSIWSVLDGEVSFKLYITYVILLFVMLHIKTLMDIRAVHMKVTPYVYANYVLVILVSLLLFGAVWSHVYLLDGFYGRLLAASAIVDVTLSVVVAVIHRLYLQKQPELMEDVRRRPYGALRLIVVAILFLFIVLPLLMWGLLFYMK